MLILIFVVAAITTITLHYFLVERKREHRRVELVEAPAAERLCAWSAPTDAYLQRSLTWSRIARDGELRVGVHPLLLGIVGPDSRIDAPVARGHVRKGDPLVRIRVADREIILPSPASGAIGEVRSPGREDSSAGEPAGGGEWFCHLRPDDLQRDARDWIAREDARDWTAERYHEMREFLMRACDGGDLGVALADGGDIPVGVLRSLDDREWEAFRARFLVFPRSDPGR